LQTAIGMSAICRERGLTVMSKPLLGQWKAISAGWQALTLYRRFESAVALMLTLIISIVILVALYRLLVGVLTGLVFGALDPLEHTVFQVVFGEIVTVLIALEFNHTLQHVVNRAQIIIQTKVVLLIALLAATRKVIILDLKETGVGAISGLAAIILVLGITYWLIRDQDDSLPDAKLGAIGEGNGADANELPSLAKKMRTASEASEKTTAT
jgi:uncharacterized membrane protein (DUF373 family)